VRLWELKRQKLEVKENFHTKANEVSRYAGNLRAEKASEVQRKKNAEIVFQVAANFWVKTAKNGLVRMESCQTLSRQFNLREQYSDNGDNKLVILLVLRSPKHCDK
jgi:hypothetical protein